MFSVKRFYAVVNLFDCIYLVTFRYGLYIHCGDDSAEVPPVLIPNTEVKLSCAESTRRATDREDRLLPLSIKPLVFTEGFLLVFFSFFSDPASCAAYEESQGTWLFSEIETFPAILRSFASLTRGSAQDDENGSVLLR